MRLLLILVVSFSFPQPTQAVTVTDSFTNSSLIDGANSSYHAVGGGQLKVAPSFGGTGQDGAITLTSAKNISTDVIASGRSTYADGISYAVSSISTSSLVASATPNGIVAGDEVMLINLQGDATNYGNVGNYEFLTVSSVSGTTINFTTNIQKIYGATTDNATLTGQKIVVQRVPNYTDVTINAQGTYLLRDTFAGSTISTANWVEIDPYNCFTQNNALVMANNNANWTQAVISQSTFTRTDLTTLYIKYTTGSSVANHVMMGWETNQTASASYNQLIHGLYFAGGTLAIYQNGGSLGGFGSGYAANTAYEIKIKLLTVGAEYWIKGGAYTNWTLLYRDTSLSTSPMRVAVTHYSALGSITEMSVYDEPYLTASAWDGTKGGVLAFRAQGTVTTASDTGIRMDNRGYRPGATYVSTTTGGYQGESYKGVGSNPNSTARRSANAGGGGACWDTGAYAYAEGGGGGGYGTAGSNGTYCHISYPGQGSGGSTYGAAALTTLFMGSAGGAGGTGYSPWGLGDGTSNGKGGAGGGIVYVAAGTISNAGTISSNGAKGNNGYGYITSCGASICGGGGGSGAGGSIYIAGANLTLGTSLVTSTGGAATNGGGGSYGGGWNASAGGAGGVGRINIQYLTATSGTTSPTANSSQGGSYATTATIQSTNLLTGQVVDGITSFVYNLSAKPDGTTATIQFSQNGTDWKNSSNVSDGTDTLTTGTNNSIDLTTLNNAGWTTANFYYKIIFGSNGGTATPVLDDITLTAHAIQPSTPSAPTVSTREATTVNVNPNLGSNDSTFLLAIYKEIGTTCDGSGGSYIAANGSESETVVWQTDTAWGTVTVTGLDQETQYTFCTKAKNAENTESSFSAAGTNNAGYIPISGDFTITEDVSSFQNKYTDGNDDSRYVMGVDSGEGDTVNTAVLTIESGILTINENETLAAGSIVLTGGSISLAEGAIIYPGSPMWVVDADEDGYPATTKAYVNSKPTGGRRKNLLATLAEADCDDGDDTKTTTCCTSAGGACSGDTCCTGYACGTDADSDNFFSLAIGHSGTCQADTKLWTDCYDGNANAKPGQTTYFATHRGDSSFDYNCDSVITYYKTTNVLCRYCGGSENYSAAWSCACGNSCSFGFNCEGYSFGCYDWPTACSTINCTSTTQQTCR